LIHFYDTIKLLYFFIMQMHLGGIFYCKTLTVIKKPLPGTGRGFKNKLCEEVLNNSILTMQVHVYTGNRHAIR